MSAKPINTSWLWVDDGEQYGLIIDADERKLSWYEGAGCACGDSFAEQTFDDFAQNGARYLPLPDDIAAEINQSLTALNAQH